MSDVWVAFLSARIHDDEQNADRQHDDDCCRHTTSLPDECTCGVPDSIRGWCHTGRRILGLHQAYVKQGIASLPAALALEQVIREMASNYRHHPDHPGAV